VAGITKFFNKKALRLILSFAIVCYFLGYAIKAIDNSLLDALERFAYDTRLLATSPYHQDKRVVIVDLDEPTLSEIGHWPWHRNHLARLVETLFEHYQVATLSFDMLFAETDESDARQLLNTQRLGLTNKQRQQLLDQYNYDQQFAASLQNQDVTLGYVFNQQNNQALNTLPPALTKFSPSLREKLALIKPKGYSANLEILNDSASSWGFFDNPLVDPDGVFRKAPLVQQHNGNIYPSLSLATIISYLKQKGENATPSFSLQNEGDYAAMEGLKIAQNFIKTGQHSDVFVPYIGPQKSFPYIPAKDILNKTADADLLKNKIILFGTTAPGLMDLRSTPIQQNYPGVEVHANLIISLLDGTTKHTPSYAAAIEFIAILLVASAIIFSPFIASPVRHILLVSGILLSYLLFNLWMWHQGMVLNLANVLTLIFVMLAFQTSWGFFVETRAKRQLAKLFGQYIPHELVKDMAISPDTFSLEGQSREMTVLFTDIRGFTNISEKLPPKELSKLMNDYLTPMTKVIHRNKGTIDKYMGDAIMAFWGAPVEDPEHATHALHAAQEMLQELEVINKEFERKGWPTIEIGIGINTGIMDVGNMGSEFRMAYTILGDAVNLGSRLEGLTKSYGVDTIVGEDSRKASPEFIFRELDRVKVKGKDRPVSIFEPVGHRSILSTAQQECADSFNHALLMYRAQDWKGALEVINLLEQKYGKHSIYSIYKERIIRYQKEPPGVHWDGVFTHTSK
jgi:adenylate cyclase